MTRARRILLLLLCLGRADPAPAQTLPPLLPMQGLSDPTLAFGLSGINDYGTARPFLNQMITARRWFAAASGEWQTMSAKDLIAGGYIDDEGWVTRIPPGMEAIRTIWDYPKETADDRAGTYILTYEGEGSIVLGGDARRLDGRPGRIVFSTGGGAYWLDIREIDPRGVGRPLRNIAIVREDEVPLFEAGVTFRPGWIDSIKDARILRFMDWALTNGSAVQPGELPLIEARGLWRMHSRGVPLSLMVELANQVGADPWFTMPHQADDAYVRAYAEYVRDTLNPDLTAHVEYSNEVWNTAFPQGRWVKEQAATLWGLPEDSVGGYAFTAREATRDALIWEDVFGAEATTRLDNVYSTQTSNFWATENLLDPQAWAEAEPESYLPISAVFDSLGVTTYFGGMVISDPVLRQEFLTRLRQNRADARRWLTATITDPETPDTPASNASVLAKSKSLANEHGLKLLAYEGGQHVHHAFAVSSLTEADIEATSSILIDYVRGPEMAAVTAQNWDVWQSIGDGPYMQFGDSGIGGRWGSFSLFDAPGLANPTSDLLLQRNATTPSWWGDPGGTRYQHGVTLRGTDADNALAGTAGGDILLALAGDDLLNPGPGLDHLHGGDGTDTVALPDPAASITYRRDGPRIIATGPSGRWHLFSIERLRFPDGSQIDTPQP